MQHQFDLFFDVKSSLEKHAVTCLIFKKISNGHDCYTTKTDTGRYDFVNENTLKVTMTWGKFFKWTNGTYFDPHYTMIDETGLDINKIVDLELYVDFDNMDKVKASLVPYGLTVDKEERQMDCIVISDPN
jgi:hypothetical protein